METSRDLFVVLIMLKYICNIMVCNVESVVSSHFRCYRHSLVQKPKLKISKKNIISTNSLADLKTADSSVFRRGKNDVAYACVLNEGVAVLWSLGFSRKLTK